MKLGAVPLVVQEVFLEFLEDNGFDEPITVTCLDGASRALFNGNVGINHIPGDKAFESPVKVVVIIDDDHLMSAGILQLGFEKKGIKADVWNKEENDYSVLTCDDTAVAFKFIHPAPQSSPPKPE